MKASRGQVAALVRVARGLGALRSEVVFVGGMVSGLLITDPGAAEARPTLDVDLVIEVSSKLEYYENIRKRLHSLGFREDTREGAPLCRWLLEGDVVDVVPTDPGVLGFSNAWFSHARATANQVNLGEESEALLIRVINATSFLATKLSSFASRGGGDLLHRDIEDIVYLVDGRAELLDELVAEVQELRAFVAASIRALLEAGLDERIASHLPGDAASQAREPLVLATLKRIADLTRSGT